MVEVGDEAPAPGELRLDFQALMFAALRAARAVRVEEAAVVHAEIGVLDRSIFEGLGAEGSAFQVAPAAHVLEAESGVHPRSGGEIKSVTNDKTLARTLSDIGNENAGGADSAARRGGGVRKPDEGHAKKSEVGVDERNGFIEMDAGVGGVELPLGVGRIANGNPGAVDEVNVSGEAFNVASFEVEGIIGKKESGIGAALNLDGAANIVKEAMAGADVVVRFLGFEVLGTVIEKNVAAGGGFIGFDVVFDVIGAKTAIAVMNIHVAVGGGQIAFAALRLGFQICDPAFGGRETGLLSVGGAWRGAGQREKQRCRE